MRQQLELLARYATEMLIRIAGVAVGSIRVRLSRRW